MKKIEIPSIPNKKEYSNKLIYWINWNEGSYESNSTQTKLKNKKINK